MSPILKLARLNIQQRAVSIIAQLVIINLLSITKMLARLQLPSTCIYGNKIIQYYHDTNLENIFSIHAFSSSFFIFLFSLLRAIS